MRRHFLVIALLALVSFGVFNRVLEADFVAWDDERTVPENPFVQGLDAHRLGWMFTNISYAMRYKPLSWLSYALLYRAAGLQPWAYHLANLLFHSLNAVLVYFVVRKLLLLGQRTRDAGGSEPSGLTWCAGLSAFAWSIHPLRVEAVARVTDLAYCESLCFLLISVWCYLRANAGPQRRLGRSPFYWASVGAFALSMLAYPLAFGYALLLLVLDGYPLRRFSAGPHWWRDATTARICREKVPFALLGALVLLTLLGRLSPAGVWSTVPSWPDLTLGGKAMQACYIWTYYLWKPWSPAHLAPVYTSLLLFNPASARFLISAAVVAGISTLVVWQRRRWPWALSLWLCHLALLLPALGLTEHPHYPSDRYSYAQGVLWSVLLAAGLLWLSRRPRVSAAVVTACLVLLAALGMMSFRQTRIWRDSVSLFEYTLATLGSHPYRADIDWRLGLAYARQNRADRAIAQYRASLAIQSSVPAHLLLAQALQAQGAADEALEQYLAALRLRPDATLHAKIGELLSSRGRTTGAIEHYREAVRLQPELWPVLNNLAWILATDPEPTNRAGQAAVNLAERACALTGQREAGIFVTLAAAYAEAGRFAEAATAAEAAARLAAQANQPGLVAQSRQLLELFRAGKPYHQPAHPQSP
jgi:tetratricopeptide (TPR) repeat protein